MRKLNYYVAVTVDGFICHKDHTIGGFFGEGEHTDDYLTSLKTDYDIVLMGRPTYEFGFQFGVLSKTFGQHVAGFVRQPRRRPRSALLTQRTDRAGHSRDWSRMRRTHDDARDHVGIWLAVGSLRAIRPLNCLCPSWCPKRILLSAALPVSIVSRLQEKEHKMYKTQLLDNHNRAHLDQAAELIMQGEIIAFGFDSIFAFIGDADQEIAARRIAAVKQQPLDKTLALVCAPDYLDEFVDLDAPAFHYHAFSKVQRLQHDVFSLGVLLPVAKSGVSPHMTLNGTILNVWHEYPPQHAARYLQDQIRKRGKRAFVGTSTNLHGEPTYADPLRTTRVFGGAIPAVVTHDLSSIPLERRQSATLVDFTGEFPRLVRPGSVPVDELCFHLDRLGLRQLMLEESIANHQSSVVN